MAGDGLFRAMSHVDLVAGYKGQGLQAADSETFMRWALNSASDPTVFGLVVKGGDIYL